MKGIDYSTRYGIYSKRKGVDHSNQANAVAYTCLVRQREKLRGNGGGLASDATELYAAVVARLSHVPLMFPSWLDTARHRTMNYFSTSCSHAAMEIRLKPERATL